MKSFSFDMKICLSGKKPPDHQDRRSEAVCKLLVTHHPTTPNPKM